MADMERMFTTKQDFNTPSRGIGDAHYKLDRIIKHLGIVMPKPPDGPGGVVGVKAPRYPRS